MAVTALEYSLRRTAREFMEARARYIKACRDMASNLNEAADRADRPLTRFHASTTVMSSSLVIDISQLATVVEAKGAALASLQEIAGEVSGAELAVFEAWFAKEFGGEVA